MEQGKKNSAKAATIFEVAKLSGFSAMTVSRTLNNSAVVSKKTKDKIMSAIKQLNYTPNLAAKSLVEGVSNTIFLYIPKEQEITHPFIAQSLAGICEKLSEKGYAILLSREWYKNQNCVGAIAMGVTEEESEKALALSNAIPTVFFGNSSLDVDCIDVDNGYGSYIMTKRVLESGRRKIFYLGIKTNEPFGKERFDGHIKCLSEYGYTEYDYQKVANKEGNGYTAASELDYKKYDCIICASDVLAIGVMRFLKEKDVNVPLDIAVTGFDGLGYEHLLSPVITTIKQPIYEVGKALAERVIERVRNESTEYKRSLYKPELLEGGSL